MFRQTSKLVLAVFVGVAPGALHAQDCPLGAFDRVTDDFFLSATPDIQQGAVGDVVAVEIGLTIEELHGSLRFFGVYGAFDEEKADLLGLPVYSDFYQQFGSFPQFRQIGETLYPVSRSGLGGFEFWSSLQDAGRDFLASSIEQGVTPFVPLLTLYFRLKGAPGDVFDVTITDDEFVDVLGTPAVTRTGASAIKCCYE